MGQLLFAGSIHAVEQAKIDAARITQKSGNERRGAETALQQFSAALSTTRMLDAAGSQINDITANAAHLNDAATTGRMQTRIQAAEAMGALAAQAGAAGVAGASVDTYNETMRLTSAIKEQALEKSLASQQWSLGQQAGNTLKGAVASIDNNVYRANLDYKQYVDHKKPSLLSRIVGGVATIGATVLGGPQAGMATLGLFEAGWAANNGDYGGASQNLMGAFQNGMGAMKSYNATHGSKPAATPAATSPASLRSATDFNWGSGSSSLPKSDWFSKINPTMYDSIILK